LLLHLRHRLQRTDYYHHHHHQRALRDACESREEERCYHLRLHTTIEDISSDLPLHLPLPPLRSCTTLRTTHRLLRTHACRVHRHALLPTTTTTCFLPAGFYCWDCCFHAACCTFLHSAWRLPALHLYLPHRRLHCTVLLHLPTFCCPAWVSPATAPATQVLHFLPATCCLHCTCTCTACCRLPPATLSAFSPATLLLFFCTRFYYFPGLPSLLGSAALAAACLPLLPAGTCCLPLLPLLSAVLGGSHLPLLLPCLPLTQRGFGDLPDHHGTQVSAQTQFLPCALDLAVPGSAATYLPTHGLPPTFLLGSCCLLPA